MIRDHYVPLAQAKLNSQTCFVADAWSPAMVTLDSPAIEVMTDLRRVPAATVQADTLMADAHQMMIVRAVRMLLVLDVDRQVLGLITATDLLGEKPIRVSQERQTKPSELTVRDLMVSTGQLDVVELVDVLRSEVGHVVATLKASGRQHALVLESAPEGRQYIRGIFSTTQIARQMGIPLQTSEIARTFAEIEAAIAR